MTKGPKGVEQGRGYANSGKRKTNMGTRRMSDWGNLVGQLWVSPVASNNRDFNWKAQNAQHKVKAMISFWGEITVGGRGIWDWTWGNPVGQFGFFQRGSALKYVTMLISMQMRLAFASPPFHEYKCTWSSLVLNSSTQAHAVTLARFSFRVPSIRKQQESWVFFIRSVVWVGAPGADVISQGSGGSGWLRWGLFSVLRV